MELKIIIMLVNLEFSKSMQQYNTKTIKIKLVVKELGIYVIALITTQTNKINNSRI